MSDDAAKKELGVFILIIVGLGILWISSGGLKSATKSSPVVIANSPATSSTTPKGSWLSFLFPWTIGKGTGGLNPSSFRVNNSNITYGTVNYGGNSGSGDSNQPDGATYYGADNPPGPAVKAKDTISIDSVTPSYDQNGKSGGEYVRISASETNKNRVLLTGMLLKSRMSGYQADIRQGVQVYYLNNLNQAGPIYLSPGQTAYIITGRSPLGYSFQSNKCIGYISNQNFIVSVNGSCPSILEYPLPARPNAFSDACLDFLERVGGCQNSFNFPSDIGSDCRDFVLERMSYIRCVADFGNDRDFLGSEWRIYLGRDQSLWKTKREIIDLVDQQGNVIGTYTY